MAKKTTTKDQRDQAAKPEEDRSASLYNPAEDIAETGGAPAMPHEPVKAAPPVVVPGDAKRELPAAVQAPSPPREALALVKHSVVVPLLPVGAPLKGYYSQMRSVNVELPPWMLGRFRRFVAGLHSTHATYPGHANKPMHVDSAADAVRWLISQLPD